MLKMPDGSSFRIGSTVAEYFSGSTVCTVHRGPQKLRLRQLPTGGADVGSGGDLRGRQGCAETVRAEHRTGADVENADGGGLSNSGGRKPTSERSPISRRWLESSTTTPSPRVNKHARKACALPTRSCRRR